MADPFEELLQKGADILSARGDASAEPEGLTLKPFMDKLSFDHF